MKIVIKHKKLLLNKRSYILFTMFSTPFIDLVNGMLGDKIPIAQFIRTLLLVFNLILCMKYIPKKEKVPTYMVLIVFVYILMQSIVTGGISSDGNVMSNIIFGMKLVLFLSEMQLLINYTRKGIISKQDYVKFWKCSCWFVPSSLIICKIIGLSNYMNSLAGLYSSVNAMSVIFIIQFVLSLYYAENKKIYWIAIMLNVLAVTLLGTKSPYLYMVAIILALFICKSKNRVRTIATVGIIGVGVYYFLKTFFLKEIMEVIEYQTYHMQVALNSNNILNYLFSGRNNMLKETWKNISNSSFLMSELLFGMGRGNFASGIEMDLFEILFAYGIFVVGSVYALVFRSFFWKANDKEEKIFVLLALICMVSFGILGGHTFLEGISACYSAILIGYKYSLQISFPEVNNE